MVRLQLFGEPVLLDGDGIVLPLWRPAAAVLAILARATDGPVSRSRVAGLLWPETAERAARDTLRQTLFRLRQQVGDVVDSDRVRLALSRERIRVDVRDFEAALLADRLEEAADLYRGDFLEGFSLASSAEFLHWADGERTRLRAAACRALEGLAERYAETGDWAAAIAAAERWHRLAPLAEAPVIRLMTLLHQTGETARALELHEAFVARLATELGTGPGPALAETARRLSTPREAGAAFPSSPGRLVADTADTGAGRSVEPVLPLVGRGREFQALSQRWRRAREGSPQFVLLSGEAGIGKTRLALEFRRWASAGGATALAGRSYRVEQTVPYGTLAMILREALTAPGLAGLDDRSLVELGRIVPDYLTRRGEGTGVTAASTEGGKLRLLEALRDLVDALAFEAPVLLLVDDLQWADDASIAALHYVWRTAADVPLMFIATARQADLEVGGAAMGLLAARERDSVERYTNLDLPPLDRSAIGELLRAYTAPSGRGAGELEAAMPGDSARPAAVPEEGTEGVEPADVAAELERDTGGNPLFLVEVLRTRREGRPDTGIGDPLRGIARSRVAELTPGARALLQSAAVLGRQFPLPLAAAVADLDRFEAVDRLEELVARGLVRQVEYGYDFAHDLLRQAVIADMSEARRAALHRAAFERLVPGPDEEAVGMDRAGAVALHAEAAGLRAEAHEWHVRAAERAARVYAGDEAERSLRKALAFADSDRQRQLAWERLAELERARSRFNASALAYREALTAAREPADRLRLRIRILEAGVRAGTLSSADAAEAARTLGPEAESAGPALLRDLLVAVAQAYAAAGAREEAEDAATGAVAAAELAGDPEPLIRALLLHARVADRGAAESAALDLLERAVSIARSHGRQRALPDARTERATELSRLGRWREAVAEFDALLRSSLGDGEFAVAAVAAVNLADLEIRRGEWPAAEAALEQAERLARRYDFPHVAAVAAVNRALLAWLRGDPTAGAAAAARSAANTAAAGGFPAMERIARALHALALIPDGELEAARGELEAVGRLESATHPIWSDDREVVALARARLALAEGRVDEATRQLGTARRVAPDVYSRAALDLELARAMSAGSVHRARRLAADAGRVLEALGAEPLLREARALTGRNRNPT